MASIRWSGIGVTDAAGSTGGTTFQRNANGAFQRNRPNPTQPGTPVQLAQQARFSEVSSHWATLTQIEMDAWIAFAATSAGEYQNRIGQTCHYTGQQLFVKLNLAAYTTAFPMNTPPLQDSVKTVEPRYLSIGVSAGVLALGLIEFNSELNKPASTLKLFATPSLSPGINRPRKSLFALIKELNADTGTVDVDIQTEYFDRFGLPIIGSKVFAKAVYVDNSSGFEAIGGLVFTRVVEIV